MVTPSCKCTTPSFIEDLLGCLVSKTLSRAVCENFGDHKKAQKAKVHFFIANGWPHPPIKVITVTL